LVPYSSTPFPIIIMYIPQIPRYVFIQLLSYFSPNPSTISFNHSQMSAA
jgi:hypothetical protein